MVNTFNVLLLTNNLLGQGGADGGDDEVSSPSASVLRPHSSDNSDRAFFV